MELREEAIEMIKERLTVILGAGEYKEETTFEELKMKSVNYSQLTTALEDEFDVEIPFMDFKRKVTIAAAADYIVELVEG
ncbi:acyl carrier protein [Candidatus Galacturonibacter soehngenii]|uniref:Acyl carrier protein n=1 Tax=Candidatus Galacturonatibacter soehngenii TaxID=2307010 RepID=A0A7V7QKT8_9FIRM|nr:acyl carrier protein [Candidatus Galacturonibacter soehngenii]KAB1438437.1 acyl carrier protein [Candidatus Galacturonibacter soehngenii]